MKRLNYYIAKLMLVIVTVSVFYGLGRAKADFTFGEPENLGPTINGSSDDLVDCISADGLEMYFDSNRSGGYGGYDLWVATRETTDDDWSTPQNLGIPVNSSRHESLACVSANGLELYFSAYNWPGGYGGYDICVARRVTIDEAWDMPENLGPPINTSGREEAPWLSTDGLELYFSARNRTGGYGGDDIWVTKRETVYSPWESPENLGSAINSTRSESMPCLSPDERALFFSESYGQSVRPGGFGKEDMWVATRPNRNDPWSTPVNLGPVLNTSGNDAGIRISQDGFMLYFGSDRPGGYGGNLGDTWYASIIPIVDLNGDRIVDAEDMCIMVDHWGENYPLCDIGPTPMGDGIVDVQDLIVLAEHLFEEFPLVEP